MGDEGLMEHGKDHVGIDLCWQWWREFTESGWQHVETTPHVAHSVVSKYLNRSL